MSLFRKKKPAVTEIQVGGMEQFATAAREMYSRGYCSYNLNTRIGSIAMQAPSGDDQASMRFLILAQELIRAAAGALEAEEESQVPTDPKKGAAGYA